MNPKYLEDLELAEDMLNNRDDVVKIPTVGQSFSVYSEEFLQELGLDFKAVQDPNSLDYQKVILYARLQFNLRNGLTEAHDMSKISQPGVWSWLQEVFAKEGTSLLQESKIVIILSPLTTAPQNPENPPIEKLPEPAPANIPATIAATQQQINEVLTSPSPQSEPTEAPASQPNPEIQAQPEERNTPTPPTLPSSRMTLPSVEKTGQFPAIDQIPANFLAAELQTFAENFAETLTYNPNNSIEWLRFCQSLKNKLLAFIPTLSPIQTTRILQKLVNPALQKHLANVADLTILNLNFNVNEPGNALSLRNGAASEPRYFHLEKDGLVLASHIEAPRLGPITKPPSSGPKLSINYAERKAQEMRLLERAEQLATGMKLSLAFSKNALEEIEKSVLGATIERLARNIKDYLSIFKMPDVQKMELRATEFAKIMDHHFNQWKKIPFEKMPPERAQAINKLLNTSESSIELKNEEGTKMPYIILIEDGAIGLYEEESGLMSNPEPISSGKIRLVNNEFLIEKTPMRYAELWSDVFEWANETNDLTSDEIIQVDHLVDDFDQDVSEFYITSGKPYGQLGHSGIVVKGKKDSLEEINKAFEQHANRETIRLLQGEQKEEKKFKDFIKIVNHPVDKSKQIISCRLTMNSGATHDINIALVVDKNSKILEYIRSGQNIRLLPSILSHGGYIQNKESKNLLDQKYSNHTMTVVDMVKREVSQYEGNQRKFYSQKCASDDLVVSYAVNEGIVTRYHIAPTEVFPLTFLK